MKPQTSTAARKPSFWRAFLPFWIALVWSIVVLSWDFHVRHAALTRLSVQVTIEGKEPEELVTVEVNGRRQSLHAPVPMGLAKIVVSAPDCEPEIERRLVGYGVTDLGSVDLGWSRGTLAASVIPASDTYELTGKRGRWTNTTGVFRDVPIGRYALVSRFGKGALIERTETEVNRNQTNRIEVKANIGSLELSSEPEEGGFELIAETSGMHWANRFPAKYARLPAGDYRLIAERPGYERELRLNIGRNQTNRLVVKFVYGAAEIVTTPAGATILAAGIPRGETPLTLTQLVPGTYQIEARLQGYDVTPVSVTVGEETTAKVVLTLANSRYRESMERARQSLERNIYGTAVAYLEAALLAQPGDEQATKLLPGARARAMRDKAEELAHRGEFDAALKALESGLGNGLEDPETMALQKKLLSAKADFEQRRKEADFGKLIAEARFEAGRENYDKALLLLGNAKKSNPDKAEIAELEKSFEQEKAKWVVESAEKQRKDEIAARPLQFKTAWQRALSEEKDAGVFNDQSWTTSKSAREVRSAFERLGKEYGLFKALSVTEISPHIFTAKVGEIHRGFTGGYYARVGVVTYGEGDTRILIKILDYSAGMPEPDAKLRQMHIDRFRARFAPLLGNDLK